MVEITVEVHDSYYKTISTLKKKGYKVTERFNITDIFLVDKIFDNNNTSDYELLNNCIILRNIDNKIGLLINKRKQYSQTGEILVEDIKKVEVPVENLSSFKEKLEKTEANYLFEMVDDCTTMSNGKIELYIQNLVGYGLFLEIEAQLKYQNMNREDTIKDLKKQANELGLTLGEDYFVKKALVVLNDIRSKQNIGLKCKEVDKK
jgi:adenylate cyclase class IV